MIFSEFNTISVSGSQAWRFDQHAFGSDCNIQLRFNEFLDIAGKGLCTHAAYAVAQVSLQRAESLPFKPANRVAGVVRLWNLAAAESATSASVVALGARQIGLAHALYET